MNKNAAISAMILANINKGMDLTAAIDAVYTYDMAMEAVANGATVAEAFAPFVVTPEQAAAAHAATKNKNNGTSINYRNLGIGKNSYENRILARDERMALRLDGIA